MAETASGSVLMREPEPLFMPDDFELNERLSWVPRVWGWGLERSGAS